MSCLRSTPRGVACLWWCAALLAAAPLAPVCAAAAAIEPAPVAVRYAVRALWARSPDVQAAAAELEAARARADAAAQPLYNPELSLEAENADVNRRVIGIGMPLDVSGKRRARSAQGDAALRAAAATFELKRQELATRWLQALAATTAAAQQSELGQQRVALMQRFDGLAAKRLKVGDISSPERDLAALALAEAQIEQATLEAASASARAILLALDGGSDITALPTLPAELPPAQDAIAPREPDALPVLAQARGQLAAATAGVEVARRARMPDPVLSLTGGEVRSGRVRDNVIGLSVSMPLPVRNSGAAEVRAAHAEVNATSASLRAELQRARAALLEARTRYAALRDAAAAFRNGRAAAFEERTVLLEKLWRAGELGTSEYLVQLQQSLDTALSGQQLENRVWQAWFDYLAAAGRIADWLGVSDKEISR